ncbi:MAG: flagellar basal body P-ring formation protein FlgA [Planctomycetes bacterium]|nr:flagellar basal body P-ring formation protein FlgA [Planctomycetota bacterium]
MLPTFFSTLFALTLSIGAPANDAPRDGSAPAARASSMLAAVEGSNGPAPVAAAQARFVLPAEARVRGTELELASLGTIECADAALRARLERFSLGWAPAPGYSRLVQRAVVQRDVAAAFPGVQVAFSGADACRVLPRTQIVRGAALEAKARAELDQLFSGRETVVRVVTASADLEVPEPRETLELRARLERPELRGGAWSVPVQLWIDGALYQTAWTAFAVELWTELPVLVRDVARGELLSPAHVEARRVKLEGATPFAALGSDALAGAVAQRDLARGSFVTDRDVKRAQLVARGEPVTLEVRKGSVVARSTVTCTQDGALGDTVKIQTADKSRELVARVAGRGLVTVQL